MVAVVAILPLPEAAPQLELVVAEHVQLAEVMIALNGSLTAALSASDGPALLMAIV
jgi:hypothetical protein